jgi:hypothetical protein
MRDLRFFIAVVLALVSCGAVASGAASSDTYRKAPPPSWVKSTPLEAVASEADDAAAEGGVAHLLFDVQAHVLPNGCTS